MTIIPLASPSDELLALVLPSEDLVRALLLRVREKAYGEGASLAARLTERSIEAAYRDGFRAGIEHDSATTYGASYDSGYQDGVRATRQAGP